MAHRDCKNSINCIDPDCTFRHPEDRRLMREFKPDPSLLSKITTLCDSFPLVNTDIPFCELEVEPYKQLDLKFFTIDNQGTKMFEDAFFYNSETGILYVAIVDATPVSSVDFFLERAKLNPYTHYNHFAKRPRVGMVIPHIENTFSFSTNEYRNAIIMKYNTNDESCTFIKRSIKINQTYSFTEVDSDYKYLYNIFGIPKANRELHEIVRVIKGRFILMKEPIELRPRLLVKHLLNLYNEKAQEIAPSLDKFTSPLRDIKCLYGQCLLLGMDIKVSKTAIRLRDAIEARDEDIEKLLSQ